MAEKEGNDGPVLHVVVVGFHHKRGGQVEYSYPPLMPGKPVNCNELPREWHHLPALALPDGAHNYTEDTVYFHLPSRDQDNHTVFGVSCYRQMDSVKLVNRASDVTRNTVQKSVCVLSRLPLYGLIEAKLALITHAYFEELDFTKTSLLQDTYNSLNNSLSGPSLMHGSQVFLGLSCRALIQELGHKVLILYKLMLLERKVLFFSSPVKPICTAMLTLLSLFPDMIESGLTESARYQPTKSLSPTLKETRLSGGMLGEEYLEVSYSEPKERSGSIRSCDLPQDLDLSADISLNSDAEVFSSEHDSRFLSDSEVLTNQKLNSGVLASKEHVSGDLGSTGVSTAKKMDAMGDADVGHSVGSPQKGSSSHPTEDSGVETDPVGFALASTENTTPDVDVHSATSHKVHSRVRGHGSSRGQGHEPKKSHSSHLDDDDTVQQLLDTDDVQFNDEKLTLEIEGALDDDEPRVHYYHTQTSSESTKERLSSQSSISSLLTPVSQKAAEIRDKMVAAWSGERESSETHQVRHLSETDHNTGFPLKIFTKGVLCHPYLCLQNYDLLSDINVRGYVVGATNMLFKQKRHLLDVIVEVNEGEVIIHDPDLRRQLALTTADLRFADYLTHMCATSDDDYLEDTEWEGGDEWVRAQFFTYLTSLLSTTTLNNEKWSEDFNAHFISAWKSTHNYKAWYSLPQVSLSQAVPGHPFRGQLVMSDVKLRLTHSMQHTESGKKINAAVSQTGKVMVQTGKAVGGALTSAKSVVSRTFSSWFNNSQPDEQKEEELQAEK